MKAANATDANNDEWRVPNLNRSLAERTQRTASGREREVTTSSRVGSFVGALTVSRKVATRAELGQARRHPRAHRRVEWPPQVALGLSRSLDGLPSDGSWASTIGINMSAVPVSMRHRSPLIVVRRSPRPGTQQLHAASPRRTSVFLREASRVRNRWILEASNIRPPLDRGLRCSKHLILLLYLAPRPGLEPGTYGLTVDCAIYPQTGMNAVLQGCRIQYL